MREHFRGVAGVDGRAACLVGPSIDGKRLAGTPARRVAMLALAAALACTADAQAQWTGSVNDGRPVVVAPGGAIDVQVALTRLPGEPASGTVANITGNGDAPQTFYIENFSVGRCGFFTLDFLTPPGLLGTVQARDVAPAETLRCTLRLYVAPDARIGRHELVLGSGSFSQVFFIDVGAALTRRIPALDPAVLAGLALAFGLLAAARLRPR